MQQLPFSYTQYLDELEKYYKAGLYRQFNDLVIHLSKTSSNVELCALHTFGQAVAYVTPMKLLILRLQAIGAYDGRK
jgi:hypothetical protein